MNIRMIASVFILGLSSTVGLAASSFSTSEYTKKCGGQIYSKCDSQELNQGTIFEAARAEVIKNNIDVMVVIGADWCPSCKTFAKMLVEDVNRDKIASRIVIVEINGDLNSARELAKKLKFTYMAYPQAFVIKTASNEVVQQFYPSMFSTVDELLANLNLKAAPALVEKPVSVSSTPVTTLELPIELSNDYGVSTFYRRPKSLTEKYINQGVAALHVYHYVDAYRSFRAAEIEDESSVMAQVGQVLSVLKLEGGQDGDYFASKALANIENIAKLKKLSDIDEAWFEFAKSSQVASSSNYVKKPGVEIKALAEAYRIVVATDKDNLDGHSLIAWPLLMEIGLPNSKTLFESVLKQDATNIGARHALLHIAEFETDSKKATDHALVLAKLVPNSAHMQHMYGHTLPQQGRWAEALIQFKLAHEIHIQWGNKNKVDPSHDWHYSHNLDLMAATYLGLGDLVNARAAWEVAGPYDSRASLHSLALAIVSLSTDEASQKLLEFENVGWKDYLKPLREELELKTDNISADKQVPDGHDAEYQVLVNRMKQNYIQDKKVDGIVSSDIKSYLAKQFKGGGFDGWSNAYLELLRFKRIAKILDMKSLIDDLGPLEFAVQNGSLCQAQDKKHGLVRCLP